MCCTVIIILAQYNLNKEFGNYSLLYHISFSTLPVLSFILYYLFLVHLLDLKTERPRLFIVQAMWKMLLSTPPTNPMR
jgi:hypothetical protein